MQAAQKIQPSLYLNDDRDFAPYDELQLKKKLICEESLRAFMDQAWKVIEKGKDFIPGWHIDAICEHLQATYTREITNLMILVPPRSLKSTVASKIFPAWVWAKDATEDFLTISNAENLAIQLAADSKEIIGSDWYQKNWGWKDEYGTREEYRGNYVEIHKAKKAKTLYGTTLGGKRQPLGIQSMTTGKGGDFIICDDLHDASEAKTATPLVRENVCSNFSEVIKTRLNMDTGPQRSRTIMIQQRIHPEDVVGDILEREPNKWEILCLPAEYNPKSKCFTGLGFEDPRTEDGESLNPKIWTPEVIADRKLNLGPIAYAAQYDQNPVPRSGGIVKIDDFRTYEELPPMDQCIMAMQSWDTAQKKSKETHSFWACTTWLKFLIDESYRYYMVDMFEERMDYPDGKAQVKYMAKERFTFPIDLVLIEDKATGIPLIQELPLDKVMRGTFVVGMCPEADKESRMRIENLAIRSGQVWLPLHADWTHDFYKAIASFPGGRRGDIIDSFSMALAYFRESVSSGVSVQLLG
jgi:predicted phage terminase large subunit-like protein